MRTFTLYRHEDETGISGTGTVAEGIEFTGGRVALRWCVGDNRSTTLFDDIESVTAVHGHGGKTVVRWTDEPSDGLPLRTNHPLEEIYEWKESDFEMRWDEVNTFPFIEDEDAIAVYGYGHHDQEQFAQLVNRYDMIAAGLDPEDCTYSSSDVEHLWAQPLPGSERFTWKDVTEWSARAFPITVVFR